MIKILHSADWHLDSPLVFRNAEQARYLREALSQIPGKIAALCKEEHCDLMLLAGDLFDGNANTATLQKLKRALADVGVPIFITPGNHDYLGMDSVWTTGDWPENVHIFTRPTLESVVLPDLDLRIYGSGFTAMDCPGLLADFTAQATEQYQIAVLHGDPTQANSPYCPISKQQVQNSGLDYLALGHIHKSDSFRAGKTLCAWPGCPMGRGYDEEGEKGVLIVTLDDTVETKFLPLDTPRFFDLEIPAGDDAAKALDSVLPAAGNRNFYRITFTGHSNALDTDSLLRPEFPNLLLRDRTVPPVDVWGSAGQDTFEGRYFKLLQDKLADADEDMQRRIYLAAEISRRILDGQEVVLP